MDIELNKIHKEGLKILFHCIRKSEMFELKLLELVTYLK